MGEGVPDDDELPILSTSVDFVAATPPRPTARMRNTSKQPSPGLVALMDKPAMEKEEEKEEEGANNLAIVAIGPQPAPKSRARARSKAKAKAQTKAKRGKKKVALHDDDSDEDEEYDEVIPQHSLMFDLLIERQEQQKGLEKMAGYGLEEIGKEQITHTKMFHEHFRAIVFHESSKYTHKNNLRVTGLHESSQVS